jgi:hypothetical protein
MVRLQLQVKDTGDLLLRRASRLSTVVSVA